MNRLGCLGFVLYVCLSLSSAPEGTGGRRTVLGKHRWRLDSSKQITLTRLQAPKWVNYTQVDGLGFAEDTSNWIVD